MIYERFFISLIVELKKVFLNINVYDLISVSKYAMKIRIKPFYILQKHVSHKHTEENYFMDVRLINWDS